jgi:hypothetical protein
MTSSHSALEPEQKAEARRARERPEAKPGDRGGTAARWEAERVFRGSVTARPWEVFYIDVAPASTGERAASSCIELHRARGEWESSGRSGLGLCHAGSRAAGQRSPALAHPLGCHPAALKRGRGLFAAPHHLSTSTTHRIQNNTQQTFAHRPAGLVAFVVSQPSTARPQPEPQYPVPETTSQRARKRRQGFALRSPVRISQPVILPPGLACRFLGSLPLLHHAAGWGAVVEPCPTSKNIWPLGRRRSPVSAPLQPALIGDIASSLRHRHERPARQRARRQTSVGQQPGLAARPAQPLSSPSRRRSVVGAADLPIAPCPLRRADQGGGDSTGGGACSAKNALRPKLTPSHLPYLIFTSPAQILPTATSPQPQHLPQHRRMDTVDERTA